MNKVTEEDLIDGDRAFEKMAKKIDAAFWALACCS